MMPIPAASYTGSLYLSSFCLLVSRPPIRKVFFSFIVYIGAARSSVLVLYLPLPKPSLHKTLRSNKRLERILNENVFFLLVSREISPSCCGCFGESVTSERTKKELNDRLPQQIWFFSFLNPWIWFHVAEDFLLIRVLNEITAWWNRNGSHVHKLHLLRFTCVKRTRPRPRICRICSLSNALAVWNHKLLVIKLIVWVFNRSWAASCITQNEVFTDNIFCVWSSTFLLHVKC